MSYSDEEVQNLLKSTDFPKLVNDRILKVAKGVVPDKLPVWIMRQAGRYLPEFREFRSQHSFFQICKTPKLACEVTLMPIRRFDLDAAIIFSDILVVPQALGMEVVMLPEKGPVFPNPLTLETLDELKWESAKEALTYVGEAIRLTRHKLEGKVPLIGFSAAPWTLMVYMIEGGGTKTASKAKNWIYAHKEQAQKLLKNLADVIIDYLVMQAQYGAQLLQIFESSAEYLTNDVYAEFILPLLVHIRTKIIARMTELKLELVPMIFFAKGGGHLVDLILKVNFEVLSLDWAMDPREVRKLNKDIVLQGNLDPCALYCNADDLKKVVTKMCNDFGYQKHIVNLGHGIYPDMNPESVKCLIDIVHGYQANSS